MAQTVTNGPPARNLISARAGPRRTVPKVSVSHRFSRLRDGTLRLRITGTEACSGADEHDWVALLEGVWPTNGRYRLWAEDRWSIQVSAEGPRLPQLLDALADGADPLPNLAARLRTDLARLEDAARRRAEQPHRPAIDDPLLRALVHADLAATEDPDVPRLRLDELGVGAGQVRADVAVLTAQEWTGIEIKGERDSLARLPRQVVGYGAVFDYCHLVTTHHHLDAALPLLPTWWGVQVAEGEPPGPVRLVVHRPAARNPAPEAYGRAQLLWRDEALAALRELDAARGLSGAVRDRLWRELAARLDAAALRTVAWQAMRARLGWRQG